MNKYIEWTTSNKSNPSNMLVSHCGWLERSILNDEANLNICRYIACQGSSFSLYLQYLLRIWYKTRSIKRRLSVFFAFVCYRYCYLEVCLLLRMYPRCDVARGLKCLTSWILWIMWLNNESEVHKKFDSIMLKMFYQFWNLHPFLFSNQLYLI